MDYKFYKELAEQAMKNIKEKPVKFRYDRLIDVMEKHEATVDDIAKKAKEMKISYFSSIYQYKKYKRYIEDCLTGEKNIDCETLYIICSAVNVSADYLLGLSDNVN